MATELQKASYAILMHIQEQLEDHDGWNQFEVFTPEIDMHFFYRLSRAIGEDDFALINELEINRRKEYREDSDE